MNNYPPLSPPYVWWEHEQLPAIYEAGKNGWYYVWCRVDGRGKPKEICWEHRRDIKKHTMSVSEGTTPEELAQAMFNIFTFMEK